MPVIISIEDLTMKVTCDECFFIGTAPVGLLTQRALGVAHFGFHSIIAGTTGDR